MTDLIRETIITPSSSTEEGAFLKSNLGGAHLKSVVIDEGNGTTNFGRIAAGTIMGKITTGGRYRPCAKTTANGAVSAATTVTVMSTDNWYVGDAIYDDGVDTGETVASITNATVFEASGNVTIADNSVLTVGDGSDTAVGILLHAVRTVNDLDDSGAAVAADQAGKLVLVGVVDESALVGDATECEADLTGITYD